MKKLLTILAAAVSFASFGGGKDIDGNPITAQTYLGYIDGGTTTVSDVIGFAPSVSDVKTLIESETGGTNGIIRSVNGVSPTGTTHAVMLDARDVHGVVESMLAPAFAKESAYARDQLVLKDQKVYRAKYAKPVNMDWYASDWEEVTTIGNMERVELKDTFVPYGAGGGFTNGTGHKINNGTQSGTWASLGNGYTILTPTGIKFLFPHSGQVTGAYSVELHYDQVYVVNDDNSTTIFSLGDLLTKNHFVDIESYHSSTYNKSPVSAYHIYQYLQKHYLTKENVENNYVSNVTFTAALDGEVVSNRNTFTSATNAAISAAKDIHHDKLWVKSYFDDSTFYLNAKGELYGYRQTSDINYSYVENGVVKYMTPESSGSGCKKWTFTYLDMSFTLVYDGDDSYEGGTFRWQGFPGSFDAYRFQRVINLNPVGRLTLVTNSSGSYVKLSSLAKDSDIGDTAEVSAWEVALDAAQSVYGDKVYLSDLVSNPSHWAASEFKTYCASLWTNKTSETIRVPWNSRLMCTAVFIDGTTGASVWGRFVLPDGRVVTTANSSPYSSFGHLVRTVNGVPADATGALTNDFMNYSAMTTTVTDVVNTVKELHYDPTLSVTWTNVVDNGHIYYVTVTNTNVSVAQ